MERGEGACEFSFSKAWFTFLLTKSDGPGQAGVIFVTPRTGALQGHLRNGCEGRHSPTLVHATPGPPSSGPPWPGGPREKIRSQGAVAAWPRACSGVRRRKGCHGGNWGPRVGVAQGLEATFDRQPPERCLAPPMYWTLYFIRTFPLLSLFKKNLDGERIKLYTEFICG